MIKLSIKYKTLADEEYLIAKFDEDVPNELIKDFAVARNSQAHFDPTKNPHQLHSIKIAAHEIEVLTTEDTKVATKLFEQKGRYEDAIGKLKRLGVNT